MFRGGTRPLPQHYSRKLTDLVRVLLRPVPDKRPSAEQLVMAKILEKELKLYLAYVNGMVKEKEAARERMSSAKAEEERGVPFFFTPLLFSFLSLFCPNSHSLSHAGQTSS